jgi:hypothetical protein
MPTAFTDARIPSFPYNRCKPVKSSGVAETMFQTRYYRSAWHRRIGNLSLNILASKNEMPCSVRQRKLLALAKKTPLYFDWLKATD